MHAASSSTDRMLSFCMSCMKAELCRHHNTSRTALHRIASHCITLYRIVPHRIAPHCLSPHHTALCSGERDNKTLCQRPAEAATYNKRPHQPFVPAHHGSLLRGVATSRQKHIIRCCRCPIVAAAAAAWLAPLSLTSPQTRQKNGGIPSPARAR